MCDECAHHPSTTICPLCKKGIAKKECYTVEKVKEEEKKRKGQKGGKRGKNIPASHCSFNRFTLRCVKMNKGGIHSNCRINQNGNCAKTKEALDEFRPALRRRKEADSHPYIRRPKPKQDNRNN